MKSKISIWDCRRAIDIKGGLPLTMRGDLFDVDRPTGPMDRRKYSFYTLRAGTPHQASLNRHVVAGLVRDRAELMVQLPPGEPLRGTKREGAVDQPEVEIESQRRPLERLQGVHVDRHRVTDDLVEELLSQFDLALPQHVRSSGRFGFHQNAMLSATDELTLASPYSSL